MASGAALLKIRLSGVSASSHPQATMQYVISNVARQAKKRESGLVTRNRTGRLQMAVNAPLNRKLRMGLVGGGQGAFIGRVHAIAAVLDNRAELVAGALSSDPARAKASAPDYDIKPERAYGSVKEMIAAEL